MNRSPVRLWLGLLAVLLAAYASWTSWKIYNLHAAAAPSELTAVEPLKSFTLVDQAGRKFDSESLRGKVWVASFFFTNCPAICWKLNQALAKLQETRPGDRAHYVSITCDPDNDTPEALARYAAHFNADPERWTFLTGDIEYTRRVANDLFKVALEKERHSDRVMVIDKQGVVRGSFRATEPDQVKSLEKLLTKLERE